jgi:hypothetical protein
MNETGIERVAFAFVAIRNLTLKRAVVVSIIRLLMALSSLVMVRPAFAQSAPRVQLEAGIEKEEVDGDLKSAIEIYQKIAANSSAPREVRSKALLRLAGCYEKLGRQARQVYEQIVRDFADQPAAAQARTRLAALKPQEHPAPPATMTVRKIEWSAVGSMDAADTDGQRAVYQDTAGNLLFGDLAGHVTRVIFKPKRDDALWWDSSRDFSMVWLLFRGKPHRPRILAVMKTDGTDYRELLRDDPQGTLFGEEDSLFWGSPVNWSWDDRYLVGVSNHQKGASLWIVSVAEGKRREVANVETGAFQHAAFSPDGRFIAYETAPPILEAGKPTSLSFRPRAESHIFSTNLLRRYGKGWPLRSSIGRPMAGTWLSPIRLPERWGSTCFRSRMEKPPVGRCLSATATLKEDSPPWPELLYTVRRNRVARAMSI